MAVPLAIFVVAATLAAAGLPVSWIVNLRVAVSANAIGQGLGALAGILFLIVMVWTAVLLIAPRRRVYYEGYGR